jgi:hypothetical protein
MHVMPSKKTIARRTKTTKSAKKPQLKAKLTLARPKATLANGVLANDKAAVQKARAARVVKPGGPITKAQSAKPVVSTPPRTGWPEEQFFDLGLGMGMARGFDEEL